MNPLIAENMELPKIFVGKYLAQHPSLIGMRDDLLSEAYEALLIAAARFDPKGTAVFATFAWWQMRAAASGLVRSQYGAVSSRQPQAAYSLDVRRCDGSFSEQVNSLDYGSRDGFAEFDTKGNFEDPADAIDAARVWEEVKDELQAKPIARGKGFGPRRAGEAEEYLSMEFGGLTRRDIADRRGVTPQTVHEQAMRMRAEFLRQWPEARNWIDSTRGTAANEDT